MILLGCKHFNVLAFFAFGTAVFLDALDLAESGESVVFLQGELYYLG